jgi:hypothetical protein
MILAEDQLLRQIVDCFMELDQVSRILYASLDSNVNARLVFVR